MLNAYQHLMAIDPKSANGNGRSGHGHNDSRTLEDPPDVAHPDVDWRPSKQVISGKARNVTLVHFGAFASRMLPCLPPWMTRLTCNC